MMYAKNFRLCVISALIALQNQISFQHSFSNSCKNWVKNFFCRFSYTCFRTIFSVLGQRAQKAHAAMTAMILSFTFFSHSFVIAFRPTILCFVCSARNMAKFRPAFSTIRYCLLSGVKCHTLAVTKQSTGFAIFRHSKHCLTMFTNFFIPNAGACNATH